jgi:hypothetical protein
MRFFGSFGSLQLSQAGAPTGAPGGGGPGVIQGVPPSMPGPGGGGFPGLYPAAGPGQSGMIGILEALEWQRVNPEKTRLVAFGPPRWAL